MSIWFIFLALYLNCFSCHDFEFGNNNATKVHFANWITDICYQYQIPSCAVSVVYKSDVVVSQKFKLIESGMEVDKERSLFRIGSLSKLLTAHAVLKCYELGLVDIYGSANDYLDFKLPDKKGDIKVWHLLAHLSGLEERMSYFFSLNAKSVLSLEEYVKVYIPHQVFPVGAVRLYSNYAVSVAGYIVERVANVSFDEFVTENIFSPLGMKKTTFNEMSVDWENISEHVISTLPFINAKQYSQPLPSSSLISDVDDISVYLLTLLNKGRGEHGAVLREDTITKFLLNASFSTLGNTNIGMGLSWFSKYFGDKILFDHAGGAPGFGAYMGIIPELEIGYFVSIGNYENLATIRSIRSEIGSFFSSLPPPFYSSQPSKVEGFSTKSYFSTRRAYRSPAFIMSILRDTYQNFRYNSTQDSLIHISSEHVYSSYGYHSFIHNETNFAPISDYLFLTGEKYPFEFIHKEGDSFHYMTFDRNPTIIFGYISAVYLLNIIFLVLFTCGGNEKERQTYFLKDMYEFDSIKSSTRRIQPKHFSTLSMFNVLIELLFFITYPLADWLLFYSEPIAMYISLSLPLIYTLSVITQSLLYISILTKWNRTKLILGFFLILSSILSIPWYFHFNLLGKLYDI